MIARSFVFRWRALRRLRARHNGAVKFRTIASRHRSGRVACSSRHLGIERCDTEDQCTLALWSDDDSPLHACRLDHARKCRLLLSLVRRPVFNQLVADCGLAANYYAISHPSLPNYVALTSGSTQGITDDGEPSDSPQRSEHFFAAWSNWRCWRNRCPRRVIT